MTSPVGLTGLRIAIYLRISTDEAHQPYSLEAQEKRLRAYIDSQDGWKLVRVFTDQMSGAKLERPDLQQAMRGARAGQFDLLLVYRVDRLSRSVRGLSQILEELDDAHVAFRSATEPFDTTTPAGKMMIQMLGVFAEFERATIIDRVIAALERKAARGEWCGGHPPLGYTLNKQTKALEVQPSEAHLVSLIFGLYNRQRLGAKAIASHLNDNGHRTRKGHHWSNMAVLTILRNRFYLGEVPFRGISHPGQHDPLVDPATFSLTQEVLASRGDNRSKRAANSSDYLLAGLIVCDRCGRRFVGNAAHGRLYRYRYYTCFSRQRYGPETCGSERLPADAVDDAVLQALLTVYSRADFVEQAAQSVQGRSVELRDGYEREMAAIDVELRKTAEAIDRYLLAFEAGTLADTQCGERVQALGARAAELRDRRAGLEALLDAAEVRTLTEADLVVARRQVQEAIETRPQSERKAILQRFIHEVRVVGRDEVRPTFRLPAPADTAPELEPTASGAQVRAMSGLAELRRCYSNFSEIRSRLARLTSALAAAKRSTPAAHATEV